MLTFFVDFRLKHYFCFGIMTVLACLLLSTVKVTSRHLFLNPCNCTVGPIINRSLDRMVLW